MCNNLTNISVAEANNNYSSVDGVLFSKDKSCLLCYPAGKSDTSYVIPEGVTDIGYAAFYCCSSLESITIPDGVTVLGGCMFYGCSGLKSVTIPDGVTVLGEYMFYGCSSLESITIPDSILSIGACAFLACIALKDIYYGGTEEGWNAVSIGINNSCLKNAAVHYAKGPSGFCGAEGDGSAVAWQYYNNGTLTISGTGAMSDFFD